MNQVHKENLEHVENALPNRQGLDTEIFGMEGIPEDVLQQHNQRIIQNFYAAQAERHAVTGNPPQGIQGPAKKIKVETPDEIKRRLADHRARAAAQKAGLPLPVSAGGAPADGQSPGHSVSLAVQDTLYQIANTSPRHPPSRLPKPATHTPLPPASLPSPACPYPATRPHKPTHPHTLPPASPSREPSAPSRRRPQTTAPPHRASRRDRQRTARTSTARQGQCRDTRPRPRWRSWWPTRGGRATTSTR